MCHKDNNDQNIFASKSFPFASFARILYSIIVFMNKNISLQK